MSSCYAFLLPFISTNCICLATALLFSQRISKVVRTLQVLLSGNSLGALLGLFFLRAGFYFFTVVRVLLGLDMVGDFHSSSLDYASAEWFFSCRCNVDCIYRLFILGTLAGCLVIYISQDVC